MSKKIKKNKKQVFIFVVGLIIVLIFLLFVNYLNKKNLSYKTKAAPNKIIGGQPATKGQFPYAALIYSTTGRCSGTLISPYWVLTAAHCLSSDKYVNINGNISTYNIFIATNIIDEKLEFQKNKVSAYSFFIHPNYDGSNNDIALIQLSEKPKNIDFNKIKLPILPPKFNKNPKAANVDLYKEGNQVTMLGFGCEKNRVFNGRLNYINVPIQRSRTSTNSKYFLTGYYDFSNTTDVIIAIDNHPNCPGDSGGSVIESVNQKTYIAGVIRGMFASRTLDYIDWIYQKMLENPPPPKPCIKYLGNNISYFQTPQAKQRYYYKDKNNCIIEVYNPTSVYKTTGYKCDPFTGESKPVTNKSDICAKK